MARANLYMVYPARFRFRRGRALRYSLVVSAVLGLTCSEAIADLLDDAKAMRPALGAKYEAAYAHVEMHGSEKVTDERHRWTQACQYLRNGDLVRKTATTTLTNLPGMKVGGAGVLAVNSQYFFQATKADANAPFTIDEFRPREAEHSSLPEKTSCRPAFVSSHLGGVSIDDLLTQKAPYARPVSAAEATLDGKRVIKVVVEVKHEGSEPVQWHLFFLPDSWAFAGARQTIGGGWNSVIEYRVGYAGDDPLRIKSINTWRTSNNAPQVKQDQTDIEITSIEFRDVPESEFRLAALGLEEPAVARARAWRARLLWINALAFGGLGVLFAVLSLRRRRRSAAGP